MSRGGGGGREAKRRGIAYRDCEGGIRQADDRKYNVESVGNLQAPGLPRIAQSREVRRCRDFRFDFADTLHRRLGLGNESGEGREGGVS